MERMNIERDEIEYVLKWSDSIDEQFFADFIRVEDKVFGGMTRDIYERKIGRNIYGQSLLTVAYYEGKPIAADLMLRNDVGNTMAYQTVDTCVLDEYRGLGVFSAITKKEVQEICEKKGDVFIYGFPNSQSYPGYVKMGWKIQCKYYPSPFLCINKYNSENPQLIDENYAEWLKMSGRNYFFYKIGKNFYLLMKGTKRFQMVGRLAPEAAHSFQEIKHPGIIRYMGKKKKFFNDDQYHGCVVILGNTSIEVPFWKFDAYLN